MERGETNREAGLPGKINLQPGLLQYIDEMHVEQGIIPSVMIIKLRRNLNKSFTSLQFGNWARWRHPHLVTVGRKKALSSKPKEEKDICRVRIASVHI